MHGSVVLITAPTADVLSRDEVKAHLRVDFGDDDALIDSMIKSAVNLLDPAGGGTLGRALRPQTWELRLSSFYRHHRGQHHGNIHLGYPAPSCYAHHLAIDIPYAPLISIDSVKYDDVSGVEQTLVEGAGFRVLGSGSLGRQAIAPLYNNVWPYARHDAESVRIRFTCGYPAADSGATPPVVETLPAPLRAWLLLVISSLYENREAFVIESARASVLELPSYILQMTSPFKVY